MNRLRRYRKNKSRSLFEHEERKEKLSEMGNPLKALCELIDFEMFRPILEESLSNKERKNNAGRKAIDAVLMFRVLFLQRYYGLSYHQIQYQTVDRTSFRQFLGIESVDDVPDEKTVWKYREELTLPGAYDRLFDAFRQYMENRGLAFNEGLYFIPFVHRPHRVNPQSCISYLSLR